MQTRDQKYAMKSFDVVKERRNDKEYKSFAKRFPTLIHTCGLMQAMAFAGSKNRAILEDFVKVLTDGKTNADDFVEKCRAMEMLEYMHQSRLAMLAAGWIKRQADALIEGE